MKQRHHLVRLIVFIGMVIALIFTTETGLSMAESSSSNKMVALTFDDGPDKKYTEKVLDILKDYKVKGTFFVIGQQVEQYPDVMKRIVKEGHALGNHSWSHSYLTKLSKVSIDQNQKEAAAVTPDIFYIHLIYNQMEVLFPDAKPYVDKNNRIQVPLRFIAESLNFDVKWEVNENEKNIILSKDNLNVNLKIGDKSAVVNGAQLNLDTSAMILHERTYVPLRFLCELVGMDIKWDSGSNTVTLSYKESNDNNPDEWTGSSETIILSHSRATVQQAKAWAISKGATDEFIDLADIIWYEAPKAGVDPVVVFCQSAKETGFGKFGGILDETFKNPAGLKTQDGGSDTDQAAHQSFASWEEGIQAQIDHLALYAGAPGYPKTQTFDSRHFPYLKGKAVTVEALGGVWATSPSYGVEIVKMMMELEDLRNPYGA